MDLSTCILEADYYNAAMNLYPDHHHGDTRSFTTKRPYAKHEVKRQQSGHSV